MEMHSSFPTQYRLTEWMSIHSVKAYLQVNQDTFHSGKPSPKAREMRMCMKIYFASFFK